MLVLNRDSVLKSFLNKVKEAKRLNMKDIKITMKEMDDLFQVVYELMSEQITEALKYIEEKKEQDAIKKPVQNKKRRVIEKIEIDNSFEPEEKVVKTEINTMVKEQPEPQKIPIKTEIVETKPEPEIIEEDEEEDDDNTLYGGTW